MYCASFGGPSREQQASCAVWHGGGAVAVRRAEVRPCTWQAGVRAARRGQAEATHCEPPVLGRPVFAIDSVPTSLVSSP
eukprot:1908946-Prymnesium_polylepis.3